MFVLSSALLSHTHRRGPWRGLTQPSNTQPARFVCCLKRRTNTTYANATLFLSLLLFTSSHYLQLFKCLPYVRMCCNMVCVFLQSISLICLVSPVSSPQAFPFSQRLYNYAAKLFQRKMHDQAVEWLKLVCWLASSHSAMTAVFHMFLACLLTVQRAPNNTACVPL